MPKTGREQRDSKCALNPRQTHRWARSFSDKLSKTQFAQILRCRYCAHFLYIVFERVVLPSGRVIMTERMEEIKDEGLLTPELRETIRNRQALKQADSEIEGAAYL